MPTLRELFTGKYDKRSPIVASAPSLEQRARVSGAGYMARTGRPGSLQSRRGTATMRRFAEANVWVRTAINRRKREISKADWKIVRLDDPKAPPNEKIVKEVRELFTFVNDKRMSLGWLLNILVEDILVLDAGCLEVERNNGGKIVALWPLDGAEIVPDPAWEKTYSPRAPRYAQIVNGVIRASYLNSELIYMMANPRSNSLVGLSPVEVLFDTIEADLYGSDLEYRMQKESAPPGMLYLGSGVGPEQAQAFREEWDNEISANRDLAILYGGATGYDDKPNAPVYTPFARSARDEQRREYMKWLATKVAAAFEMDLLAFNLSETVHRSVGETVRSKTDDALIGLAEVLADFITREILWEFDPSHTHGFAFHDLIKRDAMQEAKLAQVYMNIGCTTPNEVRAERGLDPFEWGDQPWPQMIRAQGEDPAQEGTEAGTEAGADNPKNDDGKEKNDS